MNNMLRALAWGLALTLLVLPVVAVFSGWIGAEHWPLKRLLVNGDLHHADPAALRVAMLPYAQRGFFAVDLAEAQDAAQQLPWIETAQVRKRWPDVLEVTVVERKPFARWGAEKLLAENGVLFPLPDRFDASGLPKFNGAESQINHVVALYKDASVMFAPMALKVQAITLDARGSWSLKLDNGLDVMVGREDVRPRLARFASVLPPLLGEGRQLRRVDLRYTNGFALIWGQAKTVVEQNVALPAFSNFSAPNKRVALLKNNFQQVFKI